MQYMHPDLRKRMEDRRRQEAMEYAANWRLLHRSSTGRLAWPSRQACWFLCQVGRLLVWSGQRLQEAVAAPAS